MAMASTQASSTPLPRSLGDNGSCDLYNCAISLTTQAHGACTSFAHAPPSLSAYAVPLAVRRGESGTEHTDEQNAPFHGRRPSRRDVTPRWMALQIGSRIFDRAPG